MEKDLTSQIIKVKLTDEELTAYTKIDNFAKKFLLDFESENNSQKYNELKFWSLNLSNRIVKPALKGQEIRQDDLFKINKIFNQNTEMFFKYSNDSSAMENIRKEMTTTVQKEEPKAQENIRRNK